MKKTKIIIPALGMLLLSTAASVTGTVAWFSSNNKVTLNGMQVKTKVSSNLQIAATNSETSFRNSLTQGRSALLEPVSSTNGATFFYHATNNNLDGNGKPIDAVYTQYNENVALANSNANKQNVDYAFNTNYGISGTGDESGADAQAKWVSKVTADNMSGMVAPAYGYVDYDFYLKATSSEANSKLNLSKLNLMYENAAIPALNNDKAWRVGVFFEEVTQGASGNVAGTDATEMATARSIMTLSGATNYTSGNAVTSTTALGTVTYNAAPTLSSAINAGVTKYFHVVARLWLEGEDSTCKNDTYLTLTSSWALELEFQLSPTAPVAANITSETTIFVA